VNSIASFFGANVPHGRLAHCIEHLCEALRRQSPTLFAPLVDLDFLHHTENAAAFLIEFVHAARETIDLQAIYFEMNGFDINTDLWWFSGFGYETEGDIWDLEWLADWQAETDGALALTGMEVLQEAFAQHQGSGHLLYMDIAAELSTYLITCRFMELISAAHALAAEEDEIVAKLPVLATAHDFDIVHRTGAHANDEPLN
jgi:hypothetical protein